MEDKHLLRCFRATAVIRAQFTGFDADTLTKFALEVYECVHIHGANDPNNFFVSLRGAAREACERLAPKLDKILQRAVLAKAGVSNKKKKKRGHIKGGVPSFLDQCELYQMSETNFETKVLPLVDSVQDMLHFLTIAAEAIAYGEIYIERHCWECGKEAADGKKLRQ